MSKLYQFVWAVLFILIYSDLKAQQVVIRRELRGVWISTVKMLDYPSRKGLNSYQLKQEFVEILDSLKKININAIFFQVRPAADAFYESNYEPWSEWLTGKQGQPPEPYFDPLKFFIDQAHRRGMEFHAWINPFRAIATVGVADIVKNHITNLHPDWFFYYGKHCYFNPGIPQVRQYIINVILDIVRRYNIDGLHFDDYFYPYPIRNNKGQIIPIPDYQTFLKYGKDFKNIKEWRRHNITTFIKAVYDSVKSIKPWIIFGISPNAVWRNKHIDPRGSNTTGLAAYDWLYADVLLWDSLKIVDYIAPQLYFPIGHKAADFKTLIYWWRKNIKNVNLYIGINIQGIDTTGFVPLYNDPNQIPSQIRLARQLNINGFILYRSKSLLQNPLGIYDSLKNNLFTDFALTPLYPTIDTLPPLPPEYIDAYTLDSTLFVLWNYPDTVFSPLDSPKFYTIEVYRRTPVGITYITTVFSNDLMINFKIVPYKNLPFIKPRTTYIFRVFSWDKFYNKSKASKAVEIPALNLFIPKKIIQNKKLYYSGNL